MTDLLREYARPAGFIPRGFRSTAALVRTTANTTQQTTTLTPVAATTQNFVTTVSLTAVQPTTTSPNGGGPDPVVVVAFVLLGFLILLLTGTWAYEYWQERGVSGRRRRKSHESDEIAFDVLRHRDDASVA